MKNDNRAFIFFSAISGNILEYFDFTLYTIFMIQLGKTFFSAESSEFVQILSSSAVFATGFIARPIGGMLLGYIGDKYGRRKSLIISMLGMTIPTIVTGILPGYNQIGYMAPLILALSRFTQGLCISGEGAGAAIFILEHHHNLKPGAVTGIVHSSNTAGMLLASLLGIIIESNFSNCEDAWRGAFLLGGGMGVIGLYLRIKVSETPTFNKLIKERNSRKMPILQVISNVKSSLFITFCVGGVTSSVVYLLKSINVFSKTILHLNNTTSLYYLLYSSLILMISTPIFGAITDIIGRARVMIYSVIAIIFATIPILLLLSSSETLYQLIALTLLGILAGSISGASYIFVISLFPPEYKFYGVTFSFNSGIAVFGGTTPIITLWLSSFVGKHYTGLSHVAPAFYVITVSTTFLLLIYFMRSKIQENQLLKNDK